MNTITINGKKSNEITGLLIQSLPPISLPKQRTNIEEIDGRNGDIITKLGYSAYDKNIKIGLSFNYNVDDVISYFNSNGQVIFSNEPDKYYNFQMVEQIDFNRLLRFKEAEVTMHVQPFKYSAVEKQKTFEITNETSIQIRNTGNYISRPIMTIYGTGTINLYLNEIQLFVIELGETATQITIDFENMEAYNQNTNVLMNRNVTGDYDNFKLNTGLNTISWTGTITQIDIDKYSRWL